MPLDIGQRLPVRRAQSPSPASPASAASSSAPAVAGGVTRRATESGDGHDDAGGGGAPGFASQATSVGGAGVLPYSVAAKLKAPGAQRPQITAMMELYAPKRAPTVGRAFERVLAHVAPMHAALSAGGTPEAVLASLMKGDFRHQTFMLEGLLKLYTGHVKGAEHAFDVVKDLENALGNLTLQQSLLALACEKKLPPDTIVLLAKRARKAHRNAVDVLKDQWIPEKKGGPSPALKSIVKRLVDSKWPGPAKDTSFVRGAIGDALKNLHERTFDMSDLHGGIHALRKEARWIELYAQSLDGLVQLDPTRNPVAAYSDVGPQAAGVEKYLTMGAVGLDRANVQVSKSLYIGLLKVAFDLGEIKDRGEPVDELAKALVESDQMKPKAAREFMVNLLGPTYAEPALFAQAKVVHDEMRNNGLLPAFARDIAGS